MAEIEMTIDSVRTSLMNYQRTLILKERETERYLPIWIGPAEAEAIAIKLQGVQTPRPLTHDFICTLIDTLGASLKSIVINKLENNLFYAKVILITGKGEIGLDCRPSDAVALAVRQNVPILADKDVLDRAGIALHTDE